MSSSIPPLKAIENRIWRFYRGGGQLEAMRGRQALDSEFPEEWVGSTTVAAGAHGEEGLSTVQLPDGTTRVLRDLVDADPIAFLGDAHVNRFGSSPGLLVKVLDPAERLPVHAHPTRAFAHEHLSSLFGKTEAWIILGTREGQIDPHVYLGLKDDVSIREYGQWVRAQDTGRILASMHRLSVSAGDVIFVPGGMPHAIGAGLLVAEVQEPTDYSFMCEYAGYPIEADTAHFSLPFAEALGVLDIRARTIQEIEQYRILPAGRLILHGPSAPYFSAELLRGGDEGTRGVFQVVLATAGGGSIESELGRFAISAGDGFVIAASTNNWRLDGDIEAIAFRGPS